MIRFRLLLGTIQKSMLFYFSIISPINVCFRVPYSALARTLEEIENISARLKIIEILSNYFRSVIVLTPEDLVPSVYLCLNKLAPAYEGLNVANYLFG